MGISFLPKRLLFVPEAGLGWAIGDASSATVVLANLSHSHPKKFKHTSQKNDSKN